MSTVWDLNPIVLSHTNRFFQAATLVVQTWNDRDDPLLGALMELSGNMLWASSSFVAGSRQEEKAMAYSGALVGAMADLATKGNSGGNGPAQALALMERQVRRSHDAILAFLARDLGAAGLEGVTPAQLNAAVWKRLFPEFSHELSLSELGEAIRAWLVQAAPA